MQSQSVANDDAAPSTDVGGLIRSLDPTQPVRPLEPRRRLSEVSTEALLA